MCILPFGLQKVKQSLIKPTGNKQHFKTKQKSVRGTAEIDRKLGLRMNTNGCQEVIVIRIFCSSIKMREIDR